MNILSIFVSLSIFVFCSCATTPGLQEHPQPFATNVVPHEITKQIDSILADSILAPAAIGIQILSLDDGKLLYDLNSRKLFHPASNMKLLTTSSGLHLLGNSFQFTIQMFTNGIIHDGVLRGNLSIKTQGDPLLCTDDFDSLAEQLSGKGIHTIAGNVIGDVTYFDTLSWGNGWMWDDEPEADEAFISPLTVNDNAIEIEIAPAQKENIPGIVTVHPPTSYVEIFNRSITTYDTLVAPLTVTRRHGENIIRIDGRIAPSGPNRKLLLSVYRPENYFLHLFGERLSNRGITIQGITLCDTARGTLLTHGLSHSIDSVLYQINKVSDNIAAENLLKTISAVFSSQPGTSANGLAFVKQYLAGVGIDTTEMYLVDGSGVSWYNMISPHAIVQLLRAQYADQQNFHTFFGSLPVAGIDGTLKNRMIGTRAGGNVHAKTGTLHGESNISGYVTTSDGKLLAFSILCNHFPGQVSYLRSVQDRILNVLASYNTSQQ